MKLLLLKEKEIKIDSLHVIAIVLALLKQVRKYSNLERHFLFEFKN